VKTLKTLIVALLLCLPIVSFGAIQLTPIVSSGLSSPTFVTHAGDGSNRLFITEQTGVVRVLQPGSSVPTVFLDIGARIASGGERGLLGLAFHPQYASNGRFFVYYTRAGDGTIVIAEYRVSANPNVANTTGTVLLRIGHPFNANHNGGMLAFGPDGYLYIGVGDGGSANDPPNNAQNINVLLGKILRIDVDNPDAVALKPYSSPSDNPYVGGTGRPEIFSIGWRNPWRFSFDRSTHQHWVADVGQGAREEVDTPIVKGGNYGWRVFEGSRCSGNDPSLCNPAHYIGPVFDYTHTGGRCSITGGYVYRGSQNTLPPGTYVYGDFCSGEILAWDGVAQTVLLDTAISISSFGEDEQGELYVVGLGGTLSKITPAGLTCTYGIAPTGRSIGVAGGTGSVAVSAGNGCVWTAVSNAPWIQAAAAGSGNGDVPYSVDANPSSSARIGTATIAGRTFSVNQQGSAPCTYAVSPPRAKFSGFARSGTVTVTAAAGCGWSATSNDAWITIVNGGNGTGNGAVNYSVAALPGRMSQRSGTLTVAGKTVTVVQSR
jgi:glucose/arabinose dehydrogenase